MVRIHLDLMRSLRVAATRVASPTWEIGYSTSGDALTTDLLKKEVIEAQTRIKSGKYISHEEIKSKG